MRIEKDSLGPRQIPDDAYYGAQTSRAIENYPISGIRAHPEMVRAYARIKKAAALVNAGMHRLPAAKADAIAAACNEILEGKLGDQFVVDIFQAGAGTSFHMNVNEVIAGRAAEILGHDKSDRAAVNPNDDVNLGQSTNDTFPTALQMAAIALGRKLSAEIELLGESFSRKGKEFADVVKSGRTHLMDAVPVTLGQEFRAYASAIAHRKSALDGALAGLLPLPFGGSAVGTGLNTLAGFREMVIEQIALMSGEKYRPVEDPREGLQSRADAGELSSALRNFALEMLRISNDLRLLASGPATGIDEIRLPPVQPGSSIMPGKVNPSLVECLSMLCFQIIGYDTANMLCLQAGQLELNVMMPLMAANLTHGQQFLINFLPIFRTRCVDGIAANPDRCRHYLAESPSIVTALTPSIGYARAAELFKEAVARNEGIRKILLEKKVVTEDELKAALSPEVLLGPLK